MNKKIILALTVSATVLFGGPAFVKSPHFALLFGDVDLYYELKANRIALEKCYDPALSDEVILACAQLSSGRIAQDLRK